MQISAQVHNSRHEIHTRLLELLCRVRQARDFGLGEHPCRRNAHIHPPLPIPDHLPDPPHPLLIQRSSVRPTSSLHMPTTHLVPHVCTDILEPPLSARLTPKRLHILAHLHPLLPRRFQKVDTVHGARPRLDQGERHLKPDPTVRARDERNAICERELVREDRRGRALHCPRIIARFRVKRAERRKGDEQSTGAA